MMLFSSLTYTETDEQLMERFVSKKSEKAFEELYRRYAPRLKGFFIRMMSGDVASSQPFFTDRLMRSSRMPYRVFASVDRLWNRGS